ncbi:MAG: MFS transporter [Corticimicrobacter sp.]|uniref:MFS transporter n=1 Tax=Corticimicrobacter sp. TaxID=2678536 RepID=UPI0032DA2536
MPFLHTLVLLLGPLLGLFTITLGNGFISSLTSLRLDAAGVPDTMIGLVSSSYFVGLTLGAMFSDRLIARIGHIRAYSSFASLTAVTFLLQGMFSDPWAWLVFRLFNGWAIIGIYLVVESWLLLTGDKITRGRLLAVYMIALYGSGMLGQVGLGALNAWGETAPFIVAGMLSSLSVLPMVILPRALPETGNIEPLMPRHLLRMTPAGVIGCFGSGITIAAVYSLLPVYLQRVGMDIEQVGHLMACVIFGAMVLQYPVGRWSDKRDRQTVLLVLSALCAILSVLILLLPDRQTLLAVLLFLLGGGVFAVYPVAVSHSADRAVAGELVGVIQGLLLINSIGSVISPLIISPVMKHWGEAGFFWAFALVNVFMAMLFLWRRKAHPSPTSVAPFEAAAQMSPAGAEIRVTEELVQAAEEREQRDESNSQ